MRNKTILLIFLLTLVIWAACASPGYSRFYHEDNPYLCEQNLVNIKNCLEAYKKENNSRYPPSLSFLVPRYLQSIPSCPSIGNDTYSCGYRYNEERTEYTICCFGKNHKSLSENEPEFNRQMRTSGQGSYSSSANSERSLDTATSLILLGILAVVSFLTYRKK